MDLAGFLKASVMLAFTLFYAYWFGGRIPYFIFYTTMGILTIGYIWSRFSKRVTASCSAEALTAQAGEKIKFVFEVTNESPCPVPWLQYWVQMPESMGLPDNLVCYTFSLAAHEKKVVSEEFTCKIRGNYQWGNGLIKTGDLFGVFCNSIPAGEVKKLVVLPRVYDLGNEIAVTSGHRPGDTPVSLNPGRGGAGFIGVRKYDAGDGMSRIHWKALARTQHLLVKEFQEQKLLDIMIYLDLREEVHAGLGPDSSIETAVSLAVSIAGAGLNAGYGVGLDAFGSERKTIPVGYGNSHFSIILHTLVDLKAGKDSVFLEGFSRETALLRKNCQVHVITGGLEERLLESLFWHKSRGQDSTVFLIRPETFGDKKVDFSARENSISRLKGWGVNVVEIGRGTDLRLIFRGLEYGVC